MSKRQLPVAPWIIGAMAFVAAAVGVASAAEVRLPDEIFFYQPVASVWGQPAAWINPAAIPSAQVGRMLVFTQRGNHLVRDWGLAGTQKYVGVAYRHVAGDGQPDVNEYLIGLGAGGSSSYGISYRYFKDGPGYLRHRHLWTAGLVSRLSPNLALGARAENLNRGKIDGLASDVRYVYGAAVRLYRNLVTASFDVDMTSKESFRQADFRSGIEARPIPGLYLFADVDNHRRFGFGFRLNIGAGYVGHYHNFDRDLRATMGTTYVGSVSGRQSSPIKFPSQTLVVPLGGDLPENPDIPWLRQRPLRFYDYIDGIHRAADDDDISRMFLRIGSLQCGLGKIEELDGAIRAFQARGKRVIAYLEDPDNSGYLLASAADSILIPPVSDFQAMGLQATLMSYKGLLDKVGVGVEIERVDEYKTAPEPYIFDRPTEANRRQINRILDTLSEHFARQIADGRRLPVDSVRTLIDRAPLTSIEALRCGLVDGLAYPDGQLFGDTLENPMLAGPQLALDDYLGRPVYNDRWGSRPIIALVIADGDIADGQSGAAVGGKDILAALRQVRHDSRIKGMVVRVNSPGGLVGASDLIRHEIEAVALNKPVVISMGNVAASGGYYISSVGARTFVDQSTITGSIGVFAGKPNLAALYGKIGVYSESHARGKNAGMYSLAKPFTPEQRETLKEEISVFYRHFLDIVAGSRTLSADSVDRLGRGQVWTGREACTNGLADTIGGMYASLHELDRLVGVAANQTEIMTFPTRYYLLPRSLPLPGVAAGLAQALFGHDYDALFTDLEAGQVYYRMPFTIAIK